MLRNQTDKHFQKVLQGLPLGWSTASIFRTRCRRAGLRGFLALLILTYMTATLVTFPRRSLSSEDPEEVQFSVKKSPDWKTGFSKRWYLANTTMQQTLKLQSCHVWPEQQPKSDRIEHQLLMRPKHRPKKSKLIFLTERGVRSRPAIGSGVFVKNKCPVANCKITYDQTKIQEADAILFKDSVNPELLDPSIYRRPLKQIWILSLLESPHYTADYSGINGLINWTATYRQDSELVTPYEKFVLYDPKVLSKRQLVNYAAEKSGKKKVAWFVSNCQTANKRMEYAMELAKYIDVDIFGHCGPNKCDKRSKKCQEILRRDYKFYLSFENSNCWWYITEKLWIPLQANVIPIVMGAPRIDYEAVAPHQSFIHVADFPTAKELADYLHRLDRTEKEYNSYFQWKGTGEVIDTRFYCRLCALLHAENIPTKTYKDIQDWWAGAEKCSHDRTLNPVLENL